MITDFSNNDNKTKSNKFLRNLNFLDLSGN